VDVYALQAMLGYFMIFDLPYEIQRSYFDATFRDSEDLKDFGELIAEFDDDTKIIGMNTVFNDEELKEAGLFDPEQKLKRVRTERDRSLFADMGRGFLVDDVLHTASELIEGLSEQAASSAWVVSGKHTESGKPMLVNDPHLANQIPCFFYLIEIQGGPVHATGAAFAGLPGLMIGRTNDTAWGFTNSRADTADVYLEKIEGEK